LSPVTQVSVDFFSVSLPSSALTASRFLERAGAVAYSGRAEGLREALPDPPVGGGDIDVAAGRPEHAGALR
jgi:hypothetical protein